jgi:6-phosphogluconate dehydrogenase
MMGHKIGIIGLGVMGHNLALNIERHGFPVAGYDLDPAKTKAFLEGTGGDKHIIGVDSPEELIAALAPRSIISLPTSNRISSLVTF